jgi:hypothetical protein
MRFIVPAAFILAGAVAYADVPAPAQGLNIGFCESDSELAAPIRKDIEEGANSFAGLVVSGKLEAAYDVMSAAAKKVTPAATFVANVGAFVKSAGPFEGMSVEHVYHLDVQGSGNPFTAPCGPMRADDWVTVKVMPGLSQAYVILSSKTPNNDWAMTIWLMQESGGWHINDFSLNLSTMVGVTARKMLEMAETEEKAGELFNASMLYQGAMFLTQRGPDLQLGLAQTARTKLQAFNPAPELKGTPPFTWTLNGHDYVVNGVTLLGIEGKLGLVFVLPQKDWPDDKEIDARNRRFLDDFMATHPGWSRAFGFLTGQAAKPDNSGGFRTIYEKNKGYD